jgi:hypothetical protein
MQKNLMIILVMILVATFSACEYEFIEPKKSNILPADTLSFATDIIPIFANDNCINCHSSAGTQFSLTADKAFQNISDLNLVDLDQAEKSILYSVPNPANPEPHSGVYSVDNAARILIWIQQGAMNN